MIDAFRATHGATLAALPRQLAASPTLPTMLDRYFDRTAAYRVRDLSLPMALDHSEISCFVDTWGGRVFREIGVPLHNLPSHVRRWYFDRYVADLSTLMDFSGVQEGTSFLERFAILEKVGWIETLLRRRWKEFASIYIVCQGTELPDHLRELLVDSAYRGDPSPVSVLAAMAILPDMGAFLERSWANVFGAVTVFREELERQVREGDCQNGENLKALLQNVHARQEEVDDDLLDRLVGIEVASSDDLMNRLGEFKSRYGIGEQFVYEATPYTMLRDLVTAMSLSASDVFYDLGSGYGRACLYVGALTQARVEGVEIVSDRIERAEGARKKMALNNVRFRSGHVLDIDWSEGDVFFFFNPFSEETLEMAGRGLRALAGRKRIRVVSWGRSNDYFFRQEEWLRPKEYIGERLVVFESLPPLVITPQNTRR